MKPVHATSTNNNTNSDKAAAAGDALLGAVALEYDPAAGPAKFMVGTEQGTVLACNRKAKNPADRVGASYLGHYGPVYGLHRCVCCV